jgi:hypothetical protein
MQRIQALWNRGWLGKVAIGLPALLILCCVVALLLPQQPTGAAPTQQPTAAQAVAAEQATQAPEPTTQPTPEPTEAPTNTPAPTEAPTATPEPTPEPTAAPTETPANSLTQEERQALTRMAGHLGDIAGALGEIGRLTQNYENTNQWKQDIGIQMGVIRAAHQLILDMDVPPKLGALRAAVLNATTDCDAATQALASGIDNNRVSDLNRAGELIQSCTRKLDEARPELDALQT